MKAIDLRGIGEGPTGRTLSAKLGSDANRKAAAARHAAMAPVLRELKALSPQKAAAELGRRGIAQITYKTVERVRRRLGLPDWKPAAPEAPRRRPAPNEETAAT
jgi:transposase